MSCLIRLFLKSRGSYIFHGLEWRAVTYRSRSLFISHKLLPNNEVPFVPGENCYLQYLSAVMLLFISRFSFWIFWELWRHNTGLFLVSISRNCSVAAPDFEVRFFLKATFVILHQRSVLVQVVCVFWLVLAVESLWILAILNFPQMSPDVAARQHLGLVEFSFLWSLIYDSQFRSENWAFLVKILACIPVRTSLTVVFVLLFKFILCFPFALLGKWHVCCIGSNMTSICGFLLFGTCLTRWINSFWLSVSSFTVFIVILVDILVVGNRVVGATVFVSRIILSVLSLFSLFL